MTTTIMINKTHAPDVGDGLLRLVSSNFGGVNHRFLCTGGDRDGGALGGGEEGAADGFPVLAPRGQSGVDRALYVIWLFHLNLQIDGFGGLLYVDEVGIKGSLQAGHDRCASQMHVDWLMRMQEGDCE